MKLSRRPADVNKHQHQIRRVHWNFLVITNYVRKSYGSLKLYNYNNCLVVNNVVTLTSHFNGKMKLFETTKKFIRKSIATNFVKIERLRDFIFRKFLAILCLQKSIRASKNGIENNTKCCLIKPIGPIQNFWQFKWVTPMWFSALAGRKIAIINEMDFYSPTLGKTNF